MIQDIELERNAFSNTAYIPAPAGKGRSLDGSGALKTENASAKAGKRHTTERRELSKNEMELSFDAISENEAFARVAVSAFVSHLNPTLEELSDIKTAVSEAVTNAIIHGYGNIYGYARPGGKRPPEEVVHPGKVKIYCLLEKDLLHVRVSDEGVGMENIEQAMEPLFTTKPELERSGMGFAFMEAFMDDLEVESRPGRGTTVHMTKKMGVGDWIDSEE